MMSYCLCVRAGRPEQKRHDSQCSIVNGKTVPSEADEGNAPVFINPDRDKTGCLESGFQPDRHTLPSTPDPDELPPIEFMKDHFAVILKRLRRCSLNFNKLSKTVKIVTIAIMVPIFVVSAFSMNVVATALSDTPLHILHDHGHVGGCPCRLDVFLQIEKTAIDRSYYPPCPENIFRRRTAETMQTFFLLYLSINCRKFATR